MAVQRWLPPSAVALLTLFLLCEASGMDSPLSSNPAAQPAAHDRRLEDSSRCNGHQRQPLLWRSTTTNQTVYILATYPTPQEDMLPIQPEVQNALECADIAYFELACAPRDMGNYMSHCFHYSAIETHDTLPQRVPTADFQALQAAIAKLVQTAPPECANLAANLSKAAQALPESRQTLRSFYHQAARVLHPSACQRKEGTLMYQEKLRRDFGSTRPVFGLRDVATECAIYRGGSEEEDAQMVRKLVRDFGSDEWRANMTRNQEAMEDILRCGDLGRLRTMPGVGDLPGLGERLLGQRNPMLADSAIDQIGKSPGKTLLLVLGITHLLDFGDVKSVKTLMAERGGFAFQRITSGTELSCTASSFSGPGAKEEGTCLLPPGRSQPASCDAFTNAFRKAEAAAAASYPAPNKTLSRETMGRIKKKSNCTTCVRSDDPCTCDITWENDTNFASLCNRTEVDGVRGQVVYMDLTRNPGSVHQGPGLAEKTVRGLYQSCIATSCDIGFRQEIALRHWYQQDPQLAGGVVQLRFPGQHVVTPGTEKGGIFAWPWWAWLLFILLIALCVGALLKVFLMPKRKKVHASVENHFQKVDTGVPRMEDGPSPDYNSGYPVGGGDVERRHMGMDGPGYGQDAGYQQNPGGGMGGLGGMAGGPGGMGGMGGPGGMGASTGMAGMGAGFGAGMGAGLGAGMGPGEPAARPMGGPDEGWPWPSPQPGARAFDFAEAETPMKGPTWQPHLDWPGPLEQPNPFAGFDNTILSQAMQMQQQLGDAGAQAVQQMQQQAQANWRRQNQLPPPSPLQTSASVSLQPPPSPQLGVYGMQPGQPSAAFTAPPLSGRGNSGQMGLSAPTYQTAQALSSSGASGPLFPPRGSSTPIFSAVPPQPPSPQQAYAQLGQPGLAPSGAPYPYGMR